MTRLEVSICHTAIQEYRPQQALIGRFFQQRMQAAMDHLVETVLNHSKAITLVYRRLVMHRLLKRLGSCEENLLVIGTQNSWLINACTTSPWRFVGTRLPSGLTTSASNKGHWERLENFVQRHAAPNALVNVYCLHERDAMTQEVISFRKNEGTSFQPPGCKEEEQNGIKLPSWIQTKIPASKLHPDYLIEWSAVKTVVKLLLSDDEEHLGECAIKENDASFDVSDSDSEETGSYPIDIEVVSGAEELFGLTVSEVSNSEFSLSI